VKVARAKTAVVRNGVANEARAIGARVQQEAILRGELLSNQSRLAGARAGKSHALAATKAQESAEIQESQALAAASADLAARIARPMPPRGRRARGARRARIRPVRASRRRPPRASSGRSAARSRARSACAGGTLHPGYRHRRPDGNADQAAAAGRVLYCGWMSATAIS